MEIRKRNIIINKVGGNASQGAMNYKISLPAPWVKQMGIKKHDREVDVMFTDNRIIIKKGEDKMMDIKGFLKFREMVERLGVRENVLRRYISSSVPKGWELNRVTIMPKKANKNPITLFAFDKSDIKLLEMIKELDKFYTSKETRKMLTDYFNNKKCDISDYNISDMIEEVESNLKFNNQASNIEQLQLVSNIELDDIKDIDLISADEIEDLFKLPKGTVEKWIYRDKILPAIQIGDVVRINLKDLSSIVKIINK